MRIHCTLSFGLLTCLLGACLALPGEQFALADDEAPPLVAPGVAQVLPLGLGECFESKEREYSGLAWFGDYLFLLPQWNRRPDSGLSLPCVRRDAVRAAIDHHAAGLDLPLFSVPMEFDGRFDFAGYDGFEALCFRGNTAYLTIELEDRDELKALLVRGEVEVDGEGRPILLRVDLRRRVELRQGLRRDNMGYEALLPDEAGVLAFFELNSCRRDPPNPHPQVLRVHPELSARDPLPMFALDYRLTDCTDLDEEQRFWAINYLFPYDEDMVVDGDELMEFKGLAPESGLRANHVERLVEFALTEEGVAPTCSAPISLPLGAEAHNWEGIARMDEGFLLVTDEFPGSVLAYVSLPGASER